MKEIGRRRRVRATLAMAASMAFTLLACEIGLRTYHAVMAERRPTATHEIVLDEELGWRATENYYFAGLLKDFDGSEYWAEIRTDDRGFRVSGDSALTPRARALFLGDSYTHAIQVSATDAFYSIVGRTLDIEVFAYGVGGYGTLQEVMVLRRVLDSVRPDVVVLQLCSNDLLNNHHALELGSAWSNNGLRRPYLEDGEIIYRLPRRFPAVRRFAAERSEFLYFIFSRIDRIAADLGAVGTEHRIHLEGTQFDLFAEAVSVTNALLVQVRKAAPETVAMYAFCTDDSQPEHEALRSGTAKAEIAFIPGVPAALRAAEQEGVCVRAADGGHWNTEGHRRAAAVLIDRLATDFPFGVNDFSRGDDDGRAKVGPPEFESGDSTTP